MEVFDDYIALGERHNGIKKIRIHRLSDGKEHFIVADDELSVMDIDINAESNTHWLRFNYTSLTTPVSIYEEHMGTGERRLLKIQIVQGSFNSENYTTQRIWAKARDGELIPVSLVYRKNMSRKDGSPIYLYGYGSYGSSIDPNFRSSIISLLDRGIIFAIAHVRGGQELGRPWYDAGKLLNKRNTFFDFIDVTEYLIQEKIAKRNAIVASGGSAGGLLVGAVANMRPDLYKVIVAHVPFVDVVTTMLDESIPLTTNEFNEWGNPKIKKFYDYMLSYSPYDQVSVQDYPAMFVTSGLWDSQVQYFEPTKWVAKLRYCKTDSNLLLLHTNMDAGHGGNSGRFRRQREVAMEFAFVLNQLGINR